jgi:hypothetical protein
MGSTPITVNADINGIWKKAQGELSDAINFKVEELQWLGKLPGFKMAASLREMTFPVHTRFSGMIATIPEGGNEARPGSVNTNDAQVAFIHKNGRFTVSKLARWASMSNPEPEIKKQIVFQGMDKVNSLAANLGDAFYGFSTGIRAQTSTVGTAASQTLTLKNAYGLTEVSGATAIQKEYLARLFQVGEGVALVRAGALVTNAVGTITARSLADGTITVTWAGSVTSANNDNLVLYNAILDGDVPSLAHTDYNKDLVGMMEMMTATSLHGISGATVEGWNPAYSDVTAGRYTGTKHRRALTEIENYGGGGAEAVTTIMAQGVERDVSANYAGGVRYDSPLGMEIDGDFKARGKRTKSSRRVPPGFVLHFDPAALGKKELTRLPSGNGPGWPDGKELTHQSAFIFTIDHALVVACRIRKRLAYFANQQEA